MTNMVTGTWITHTNVWESMGTPCCCTQFTKRRIFLLLYKYHHSTKLQHEFVAVCIVTSVQHE